MTKQKLDSDVADLLLKVWTPGLERELKQRGWQRGWQGPYIREPGRPPTSRGAWVVALLVDDFLSQVGAKKPAEHATALALLLLGRAFRGRASLGAVGDLSDFYKFRLRVTQDAVRQLTDKIIDAYDFLLHQDGVRDGDLPVSACGAAQWWARHKALPVILQEFTPIGVAEWMLQLKIPDDLWQPFWAGETQGVRARSASAHGFQKPSLNEPKDVRVLFRLSRVRSRAKINDCGIKTQAAAWPARAQRTTLWRRGMPTRALA